MVGWLQRRTGAVLVTGWFVLFAAGVAMAGLGERLGLLVAAAGVWCLVAAVRR